MASVETAKEAERGIVDIETLKKTNAELIQTLDDVMKIQSEGREKRIAAEAEMAKNGERPQGASCWRSAAGYNARKRSTGISPVLRFDLIKATPWNTGRPRPQNN